MPNRSEKLTYVAFNSYGNKMDSIAEKLPKISEIEVFMGVKFGENRNQVIEKLFQSLENEEINYDSEAFYIYSLYKDVKYKFLIEFSYVDDILYQIEFECENAEKVGGNDYDRKMALFQYFKPQMSGCKLLKEEGRYYNNALKYEGTIRYAILGNKMYIEDLKLSNELIKIDEEQALKDLLDDAENVND